MKRGGHFRRLERAVLPPLPGGVPNERALAAAGAEVGQRFAHLTGLTAVVIGLARPGAEAGAGAGHPQCTGCSNGARCRRRWPRHVAALRAELAPHWHRCEAGKLCGVAPLCARGVCLAACRVVAGADMSDTDFQRALELLETIAEAVAARHGDVLGGSCPPGPPPAGQEAPGAQEPASRRPMVRAALERIAADLADPALTVRSVARALGVSSTYLSHVFALDVGTPMHRYIAARRLELARRLLATTDWPVKRVAFASGHGNADWFSHVFHAATGMTPTEYRRGGRSS